MVLLSILDQDIIQGDLSSSDGMKEHQLGGSMGHDDGDQELNDSANELSGTLPLERAKNDLDVPATVDMNELRGLKRSVEYDVESSTKKSCTITVDSDGEDPDAGHKPLGMDETTKLDGQIASSSESDSDSDDSDADTSVNARYIDSHSVIGFII